MSSWGQKVVREEAYINQIYSKIFVVFVDREMQSNKEGERYLDQLFYSCDRSVKFSLLQIGDYSVFLQKASGGCLYFPRIFAVRSASL